MSQSGISKPAQPLMAKCRTSRTGGVVDLEVLDLSPIGCMVDRRAWGARTDDRVLIKLDGLAYLPATVVWVEDDRAGIMFEELLYEPVLARLRRACLPRKAA
ncbi:MAG: PilZ domain-containing protein [Candidatus Andeanibacterium colombiense]|uniref:PilZ domain-containing protein n=1 Tax=Candidatus Andeanibacterium colombiense TaxID=3121345 RepID=A0AAJ5X984_9SPHN|nr:MAG: PilZ domain-containing protein [Sphingomonadaceae bacterium]